MEEVQRSGEASPRAQCRLREPKDLVEGPGVADGVHEEKGKQTEVCKECGQKGCLQPQCHDGHKDKREPTFEACSVCEAPQEASSLDGLSRFPPLKSSVEDVVPAERDGGKHDGQQKG